MSVSTPLPPSSKFANLANLAELKFAAHLGDMAYTAGFAEAVKEIYTTNPEDKATLQQLVVHRRSKHIAEMLAPHDRLLPPSWLPFIHLRRIEQEAPEFAMQLTKCLPWTSAPICKRASDGKLILEERYRCSDCKNTFVMQSAAFVERHDLWCPYCGTKAYWQA